MRRMLINMTITLMILDILFSFVHAYLVPRCEKVGGIMVESQWGHHCVDQEFKIIEHY